MKRSLRSWLWRVPLEQEFDEEIALHIEMRTRELVDGGMEPAAARALAIKKMGDVESLKRACVDLGRKRDREMSVALWLEEFMQDITFALRQLRTAPAFTLVATLTLALGIGANSAIFALVDATLLRPLPYGDPDRLVTIWDTTDTTTRGFASPPNMLDWKARSRSFETIAGFTPSVGGMVMEGRDGNAENISRQWVTAGIFDVLGVTPIAGRTFSAEDEQQMGRRVVISEGFWETRFNRDPSVIGSEIKLDGTLWTVVGVVAKEFEILGRTSMWAMNPFPSGMPPRVRGSFQLQVVGRLKPGVGIGGAQSDLSAVAAGLATEYPQFNKGRGVRLEPLHDTLIGSDLKTTSMLFLGV
ncbi:MAG TPA: ABC transporter permease, partial [Opitutaceae bacterium]|nr:ABC transporter permease [Opitutaceae bacterium]